MIIVVFVRFFFFSVPQLLCLSYCSNSLPLVTQIRGDMVGTLSREKRLPAMVDRAVWEKVTKGRAGIRWDSVVDKVWKDT